jgi:antitoxin VapB
MAQPEKAKVFMTGRSQAVRIPAEYRFTTDEVYIRRDPQSGDLILSEAPGGWDEIFAGLDKAGFPMISWRIVTRDVPSSEKSCEPAIHDRHQ